MSQKSQAEIGFRSPFNPVLGVHRRAFAANLACRPRSPFACIIGATHLEYVVDVEVLKATHGPMDYNTYVGYRYWMTALVMMHPDVSMEQHLEAASSAMGNAHSVVESPSSEVAENVGANAGSFPSY